MSAKREVSAEMAMEILSERQRRGYRKALELLRRHFAFAMAEMSVAAKAQGFMQVDPKILATRFETLDKIAAEALADSGTLDATTKEEASRIIDENQRLRLLVHASVLLHEKVRKCEDRDESETDEREWYWAARDVLGTRQPPIPHGAEGDSETARGWINEARTRETKSEPEEKKP